jgi:hypothetical protein
MTDTTEVETRWCASCGRQVPPGVPRQPRPSPRPAARRLRRPHDSRSAAPRPVAPTFTVGLGCLPPRDQRALEVAPGDLPAPCKWRADQPVDAASRA